MRLRGAALLTTATLLLLSAPAGAQNCVAGPECSAAGDRLKAYTAQMQARLVRSTGTANAATMNYCVMMVGAEVSRVCAVEQREMGRKSCAALAGQQQQVYIDNARKSEAIVRKTSQAPWQQICGW